MGKKKPMLTREEQAELGRLLIKLINQNKTDTKHTTCVACHDHGCDYCGGMGRIK